MPEFALCTVQQQLLLFVHSLQQGLQQGIKQGLQQGIRQGEHNANLKNAKAMKAMGLPFETIQKITGLTREEIDNLQPWIITADTA